MRTIGLLFVVSLPLAITLPLACSSDEDSGGEGGSAASGVGGGAANAGMAGTGVGGATAGATGVGGTAGATSGGSSGSGGSGFAGTMSGGTGGLPPVLCGNFGEACTQPSDCCSGMCSETTSTCDSPLTQCLPAGSACGAPTECCNLSCVGAVCAADACISDGQACQVDEDCCGGTCSSGTCQALNPGCRTSGNDCTYDWDCCSGLCSEGKCDRAVSFCVQTGDVCIRDIDCCSSTCNLTTSGLGTCNAPPTGPTRCGGVEGELCIDCNDCCSRVCVPFGTGAKSVCQPAQGCRILGDLCRRNEDCCGGDVDSGLPGAGNVTCYKETQDAVLGVCRNPQSCSPQGNVCHYKANESYACSSSSAPNNCCGDTGGQEGMCQLDGLGVPRCYGIGTCRAYGETCSNTMDCCDNVPCVPDELGVLRCYQTTGPNCVEAGGPCTVNGDCCPPQLCIRPTGSTIGVCGLPEPPPGTGGSAGATSTGGAAGTPATGGSGGTCAQYGQICTVAGDCCAGVPCTDGICKFPIG